jgi:hypothetical protein
VAAAKYRFSVAAHTAYCLVTVMLFALVVRVAHAGQADRSIHLLKFQGRGRFIRNRAGGR